MGEPRSRPAARWSVARSWSPARTPPTTAVRSRAARPSMVVRPRPPERRSSRCSHPIHHTHRSSRRSRLPMAMPTVETSWHHRRSSGIAGLESVSNRGGRSSVRRRSRTRAQQPSHPAQHRTQRASRTIGANLRSPRPACRDHRRLDVLPGLRRRGDEPADRRSSGATSPRRPDESGAWTTAMNATITSVTWVLFSEDFSRGHGALCSISSESHACRPSAGDGPAPATLVRPFRPGQRGRRGPSRSPRRCGTERTRRPCPVDRGAMPRCPPRRSRCHRPTRTMLTDRPAERLFRRRRRRGVPTPQHQVGQSAVVVDGDLDIDHAGRDSHGDHSSACIDLTPPCATLRGERLGQPRHRLPGESPPARAASNVGPRRPDHGDDAVEPELHSSAIRTQQIGAVEAHRPAAHRRRPHEPDTCGDDLDRREREPPPTQSDRPLHLEPDPSRPAVRPMGSHASTSGNRAAAGRRRWRGRTTRTAPRLAATDPTATAAPSMRARPPGAGPMPVEPATGRREEPAVSAIGPLQHRVDHVVDELVGLLEERTVPRCRRARSRSLSGASIIGYHSSNGFGSTAGLVGALHEEHRDLELGGRFPEVDVLELRIEDGEGVDEGAEEMRPARARCTRRTMKFSENPPSPSAVRLNGRRDRPRVRRTARTRRRTSRRTAAARSARARSTRPSSPFDRGPGERVVVEDLVGGSVGSPSARPR